VKFKLCVGCCQSQGQSFATSWTTRFWLLLLCGTPTTRHTILLSDSTRQKLIDLFHGGHSPSSALHCVKTELMVDHPDEYHQLSADSSIVPSYSVVCYLYKAEFSKDYGELGGEIVSRLTEICLHVQCYCARLLLLFWKG